jgi:S-adenosylmethionine:tRNA ribosyltransferase-isomerase
MRTADFDYDLPAERIAQTPAEPRDSARMLVLHRAGGSIEHRRFRDIVDCLVPGDRLVVNRSRVIPARLRGRKASGGAVEVLLLHPLAEARTWACLIRGRVRPGTRLSFGDTDTPSDSAVDTDSAAGHDGATVVAVAADGTREVRFDRSIEARLDRLGEVPLPPYIKAPLADPGRYQTVYAEAPGSAAAPTAGLHFTPELIADLMARGIDWSTVTLHIGLDTFRPVEAEAVADHQIHREWAVLDADTAEAIRATRRAGGRIVAVGTTTVRVLETAAGRSGGEVEPFAGWTDLFITPGYAFRAVDALITNFHLPRSSLLMLVAAFAGKDRIDRAYAEAIREGYRFFSFGDAMLID